jgi:ABC-type transport system involved in cytochrome c biogenesis permease subunit
MATSELARPQLGSTADDWPDDTGRFELSRLLTALASLRLTVVLFALSIFLVFVGTLAQKDHDVWYVVEHAYFRVWVAHVEWRALERLVQMFAPVHWNLTGSFPFPGGNTIGLALLANLLAAHALRFKVSASGGRLAAGLGVIAVGILATAMAIQSGMIDTLASELSPAFCNLLWQSFRVSLAGLALVGAYVLVVQSQHRRRVEWKVLLAVDGIFVAVAGWLFLHPEARLDDSGLRILWQLLKGGFAGGVLLAGCVFVFRKRAGIVLLHGGVALLMCSELLTGILATESQMQLDEGASANFSYDIRTTELAVVDRSGAKSDRVTVVPQPLLVENVGGAGQIESAELPFAIRVLRWLPNSRLSQAQAGASNPATAGAGLRITADEARAATGTDREQVADRPSLFAELLDKTTGQSLGVYLFSTLLDEQPVDVDGRQYSVSLRDKRTYYPFTMTLKDFRFDRYTGTNTAKNYSSLVQLVDPAQNVDREVLVWMNNPLRYAGLTFYQQTFDERTERTSVLQVVKNPGWMIPYVACMLVATGMLAHFGVVLARFLRRREEEAARTQTSTRGLRPAGSRGWPATFAAYFPALVVLLAAGYLASKARLPESAPSEMQIFEFGKLPLAYEGRIKPYDTVARNALQILSGRQEVIVLDENGEETDRLPAIRWLLDLISGSKDSYEHAMFRVDNLDLLQTLGLEPRQGSFRYSYTDIEKNADEFEKQAKLADEQPEGQRSLYQNKALELARKRNLFLMLAISFRSPPLSMEREEMVASMQQVQSIIAQLRASQAPHSVPPVAVDGRWQSLMEAELELLRDRIQNQPINPATAALATMLDAYSRDDATKFNQQLAAYRTILADYEKSLSEHRDEVKAAGLAKSEILSQNTVAFEVFYNQFSPVYYASVLYLFAFLLGVLSWVGWTEPLRRASMWLLVFTFVLHTLALAGRIYISGRPPVTNLYSAAVFIGWGCVLLALVFEWIYRLGMGNIVAAVIGFLTLLVAHFLSLDGDTFIVLQAVLDTQFWLATHVVCIALGNSTTYVAGMFGIMYVLFAHVLGVLDQPARKQLMRMTYGTLCFAIFFSFVGTVLGGLWADDSWGRFWGWDPKENGALMIVLYNALVLHARWGGMVRERGLALLVIGGNIVTTWSLFGVNAFGVGLHAYGGSDRSTSMWLLAFAASQAAIILLGALPSDFWRRPKAGGQTGTAL